MTAAVDYLGKFDLKGRFALVTGAGQGIGAACAEALAAAGAHVVCSDMRDYAAQETAERIQSRGLGASSTCLDVTDTTVLTETAKRYPQTDILVCNAGAVTSASAEDMTDMQWQQVIDVNLTGVFRSCRAFAPAMIANRRGAIVNVGSMSGHIVNTPQRQAHYNASKAAVHQLTRSLAVEWAAHGIRVNAVAPTYVQTPLLDDVDNRENLMERWLDLTPMNRLGEPHEVASAVHFLASDAASLITGTILNVDAGYTCL